MTLKIENNNYYETPPPSRAEVCGVVKLLDDESLARNYLTLSLNF
jgi:hypothetical protein